MFSFRLDPQLVEEVQRYTGNATEAVEAGLVWWLKQARRKAGAADLPAKRPATPTARKHAARRGRAT